MRWARRLLWIGLFVGAVYVAVEFPSENAAPVEVDYLYDKTPQLPLWVALVASFALGATLTGVFALYRLARLGMVTRRYRKAANGLEAEVHQLRSLPLAGAEPLGDAGGNGALAAGEQRAMERGA